MSEKTQTSTDSMAEATRSRASFSGHGGSLGAAGYREAANNPENCEFLNEPGSSIAVSPGPEGFESMLIGVAWDNVQVEQQEGFIGKFFKKYYRKEGYLFTNTVLVMNSSLLFSAFYHYGFILKLPFFYA